MLPVQMKHSAQKACAVAALAALLAGGDAGGQSMEASRARLAALRSRIAALTGRLGTELAARDALRARLRLAELDITAKRQRLDSLHTAEVAATRRATLLHAEEQRTRAALATSRSVLAGEMRAAYLIGRQEPLKLLLNQHDPAAGGRLLAYYGYFSRERATEIESLDAGVRQLAELGSAAARETAALLALQDAARRELEGLVRARAERGAALAALALEVSSGSRQLAELKHEAETVEALLADLARVLKDFPVDTQQPFEQLRGRLPWPVAGRLAAANREPLGEIAPGAPRGEGISIETARGAKVRAPYFGRVVYADWLPGLGLLIILGHSGGYLTLYGHTEVLYKSVGDWVSPGDVIAGLNDADGAAPRLYFEIRQGRKPLDAKLWMKSAP
jgi:septal ring factor EnvC (AmiA/AmiB activator)